MISFIKLYFLKCVPSTDMLPAQGFLLNCLVMKLEGGSGGPVRVIAIKDYPVTGRLFQQDDGSSGIRGGAIAFFFFLSG